MLNIFVSFNDNYMQTNYLIKYNFDTICVSDISFLQGAFYLNID